ncbi:GntR family transcriptional regulator [Gemmobacter caeruleus]|uniref:GntR family transcriptional regulator n=1 Tax=Gemmobacter caeruleus TaxID=2595004 RepID=UPI0011ECFECB|nr:GntR family transcriptional regulator [Gemmobacter caeruleus]
MDQTHDADLRIAHSPTKLRELAVDRLRQAIISGRFAGGSRLVERTLCDQLGVSRSVVREAIRYLEAEGLVETQGRSGPVVATLDWPRARQIYDIRRLLEAAAAAACATRADEGTKKRLRAALDALKLSFENGQPDRLLGATTHFYQVIFDAAGHDIAWEIVQRLNGRISRLRAITLATSDRSVSGHAHMQRICAAICAHDPEAAAAAVNDHLRDAAEIARISLEGQP